MPKSPVSADGLYKWLRSVEPQRKVEALAVLSSSSPDFVYPMLKELIDNPQELVSLLNEVKRSGRGMGSGLKRALASVLRGAPLSWFSDASVRIDSFDGTAAWTWRDVLKVVHPEPQSHRESQLYRYLMQRGSFDDLLQAVVSASSQATARTLEQSMHGLLTDADMKGNTDVSQTDDAGSDEGTHQG